MIRWWMVTNAVLLLGCAIGMGLAYVGITSSTPVSIQQHYGYWAMFLGWILVLLRTIEVIGLRILLDRKVYP